ncbi:MAG: YggT family protein [Parachlamydiaceae bacterium]|nr:YggT family protein [Parachlamydiaceae bacterium]
MLILHMIHNIFFVYMLMIMVRIFGSWFPNFSQSRFMQFIAFYTDPYLNFFRSIIPPLGMLDLSPIVAIFILQIIEKGVLIMASKLI